MIPRRDQNEQRKADFYRENATLFHLCDTPNGWLTPCGGKLVVLAKGHFQYAPTTSQVDIWRSLMRHYRKVW
jgi:hypothetical protein